MQEATKKQRRFVTVPLSEAERETIETLAVHHDWSKAKVVRNLMREALAAREERKAA